MRFSIIVGSAGFLVLYLIVLADLLVGEGEAALCCCCSCWRVHLLAGFCTAAVCMMLGWLQSFSLAEFRGFCCCIAWHVGPLIVRMLRSYSTETLGAVHHCTAGTEQYSGIIPDLWPQLPDPLPWFLQRTAMLTWVTLLVAPSLREWAQLPFFPD